MSKRKLSQKRRVNNQGGNTSKRNKVSQKTSKVVTIIGYLATQFTGIVFTVIFEQPVRDLFSGALDWIKVICISMMA